LKDKPRTITEDLALPPAAKEIIEMVVQQSAPSLLTAVPLSSATVQRRIDGMSNENVLSPVQFKTCSAPHTANAHFQPFMDNFASVEDKRANCCRSINEKYVLFCSMLTASRVLFFSFFGDFFSFNFGGQPQHGERETPKGDSFTIPLEVTLEEIYSGNFVEVCVRGRSEVQ